MQQEKSPETPARVRGLATPLTLFNLTNEAVVAIVVSQIKTLVWVLVLDFEFDVRLVAVLGLGAHPLRLARRKASSEHAVLSFARISDPDLGLGDIQAPAPDEAASHCDLCVDRGDHGEGDGGGDLHDERYDGEEILG